MSSDATDTGYAPKTWEFDGEVARVFDDMLERSIPDYVNMRELVTSIACSFAQPQTAIVDLGCSRGEAIERVYQHLNANSDQGWLGEFVGAEISEPMLDAARARLGHRATILSWDLRKGFPRHQLPVSVSLCVLTLMFVPTNYRTALLTKAAKATVPGGAFLLVEKVVGMSGEIDDVLQAHYHQLKHLNGYSPDEIDRKRLSLEGVLIPDDAEQNERRLRRAGFSDVDCFWAWGPFRAWVGVNP